MSRSIPIDRARRALVGGAAAWTSLALSGCGVTMPQPVSSSSTADGLALLQRALDAHGATAYSTLRDVNLSFDGEWYPTVGRLLPVLVDPGFRQRSEERLMPGLKVTGQQHRGPSGEKHVFRTATAVSVWVNGIPEQRAARNEAGAAVPDGFHLFTLGPIFAAGRMMSVESAGRARLDDWDCDLLLIVMRPGMGFSDEDRALFWIDRTEHLMRRVRFTFNGLPGTRGAVVDVDVFDYIAHAGVRWPTRYFEQVRSPLPLKVHSWWLTGLDVNRGYSVEDISGSRMRGLAATPARPLIGAPTRIHSRF